jgi:beta-ureidopropionase / N-carbamoyl-L-amino-acid hydrolase
VLLTLDQLNAAADGAAFAALLEGMYEHSPWIALRAWNERPAGGFASVAAVKFALSQAVRGAGRDAKLGLIRAHPELAGKAKVALTIESRGEQQAAGLAHCSPKEFDTLQRLNADYNARFGWPFILAVRGPRGTGLSRAEIVTTFERRLQAHPDAEFAECLRHIYRIAELRLNDKLGVDLAFGEQIWHWAEALAQHSDTGYAERGELTVTYLTDAHRACAAQLQQWMREAGFDEVNLDAVGNVVGVYNGATPDAQRLLTGSHYDTVRNGGKLDGRLGILAPMAVVQALFRQGRRLPFAIEVIGFAEEEGQRYKATFLGSSAVIGQFNAAWLAQADAQGVTMRQAMAASGLHESEIASLKRDPQRYLGFVEVHIEQGPVLNEMDLPLGVVTSINGSVRMLGEVIGLASHAGTTPMKQRRDAAAAVAELLLFVEQHAEATPEVVATVGMFEVPSGSINVVPGRCRFSLDIRATGDVLRDACVREALAELNRITERRGVRYTLEETMRAAAAPSDPLWQQRWEQAVQSLGVPLVRLPSGAGHDAMKLHELMPQAMLFVRGMNGGISHNPLECSTADDIDLAARAFKALVEGLAAS